MQTIETIFKEIDELENKIKTEINLEKLKEIREEIRKLENPKLEEIIDLESIKGDLWNNLRFASTDARRKAFFQLVEAECDNALLDWEHKVTLISKMEEEIKKEIDKLHKLLDETENRIKMLEKDKEDKMNVIHSLQQKLLKYDTNNSLKNKTSKSYKTFTITIFLIFSLILAAGSSMIFNKIAHNADVSVENLKNVKVKKVNISQTNNDRFAENNNEDQEISKFEQIEQNEKQIKEEVSEKKDNQFELKYLILSLVFLAFGKVISMGYEQWRHPKWMKGAVIVLFVFAAGGLLFAFFQLKSLGMNQQEIISRYNNDFLVKKSMCENSENPIKWNSYDIATRNDYICLIISDILTTPIYKTNEDKNKDYQLKKANFLKNLKSQTNHQDTEDDDSLSDDEAKIVAQKILDQYKIYKEYKDSYEILKEKLSFYSGLEFVMAIIAEILFSSMAWMMLSEKFYAEKIIESLELDIKKLTDEIEGIDKNMKSNKTLIGKIKDKLQELNNYLSEIKSLNQGFYEEENISNKKEIIKKACLSKANIVLQGIESEIIKKLAKENS